MVHRWGRLAVGALAVSVGVALCPAPIRAQDLLDRTPNLSGGWVSHPGLVHFNFLHRFTSSDVPERKVTSAPTFLLAAGLPGRLLAGFQYATNSTLAPNYPNEWEFFGRFGALRQTDGAPLDLSAQADYNLASDGPDGEISAARRQGPVRVLAAVRVLSPLEDEDGAEVALAGGATLHLTRDVAIAADVGSLTDRRPEEDVAWGVALQLGIPHSPHTFSLQVGNTNTATLQGSSRGGNTRYGFEFTIPITLARYFGGGKRPAPVPPAAPPAAAAQAPTPAAPGDTVEVVIEGLGFHPAKVEVAPGTAVRFTNRDRLVHTATENGGGIDSGEIQPGASKVLVFTQPGAHPFHCTPHPFMTGTIEVRSP
jgi:plastocyanin